MADIMFQFLNLTQFFPPSQWMPGTFFYYVKTLNFRSNPLPLTTNITERQLCMSAVSLLALKVKIWQLLLNTTMSRYNLTQKPRGRKMI
uniref:Uncharacterized protein n=1 Tax=Arundo donax TaxID=35708 RepID=A0A0A8XY50_ARUDO